MARVLLEFPLCILFYYIIIRPNNFRNKILNRLDINYEVGSAKTYLAYTELLMFVLPMFTLILHFVAYRFFSIIIPRGFSSGLFWFVFPSLFTLLFMVLAAFYHFRPNSNRIVKYSFFFSALISEICFHINYSITTNLSIGRSLLQYYVNIGLIIFFLYLFFLNANSFQQKKKKILNYLRIFISAVITFIIGWFFMRLTISLKGLILLIESFKYDSSLITLLFWGFIGGIAFYLLKTAETKHLIKWTSQFYILMPFGNILLVYFLLKSLFYYSVMALGYAAKWHDPMQSNEMNIIPALFIFGIFRYLLIKRLSEKPILYLRSFSNPTSAFAFGKTISPVIHRYLPVVALVHGMQPAGMLFKNTSLNYTTSLFTVDDSEWEDWVLHYIQKASLIIIDVSKITKSVDWELNNSANKRKNNTPILLMINKEQDMELTDDTHITKLIYNTNKKDAWTTRKSLAIYMKHYFTDIL